MAGKRVKPKSKAAKAGTSFLGKVRDVLTGGPGKRAGASLGTGLINMHKKKK